MKKQRLLLVALLFSASGWVCASVPIIKLREARTVAANVYSALGSDNYSFGIKDNLERAGTDGDSDISAAPASYAGFGVYRVGLNKGNDAAILAAQDVSEGSFASYAGDAFSSSAVPASDAGLSDAEPGYGSMVALPAAPKIWAVLLLALACVFYQGRRRQRPFGFKKIA